MRTRTITSALVTAALLACVGGTTAVAACFGLCDGSGCPGLFCGCAGSSACACAALDAGAPFGNTAHVRDARSAGQPGHNA